MNIEVPKWLFEISNQMNTDEKRATSHPFWQVRNKEYVVTEQGYNEHHFEICGDDGCLYHSNRDDGFEELAQDLLETDSEWCKCWLDCNNDELDFSDDVFISEFCDEFDPDSENLPPDYKVVYMQEIEVVLTTHLTKSDAEWFISRKKHDYPNAYTYVESAYWSPQFKQLQDWIKSLSERGEV